MRLTLVRDQLDSSDEVSQCSQKVSRAPPRAAQCTTGRASVYKNQQPRPSSSHLGVLDALFPALITHAYGL